MKKNVLLFDIEFQREAGFFSSNFQNVKNIFYYFFTLKLLNHKIFHDSNGGETSMKVCQKEKKRRRKNYQSYF